MRQRPPAGRHRTRRPSSRRPFTLGLALLGALILALVSAAATLGAASGGTGGKPGAPPDGRPVATMGNTPGAAVVAVKVPTLKPVPKVVRVKSREKPPKRVKFNGRFVPGGVTTAGDAAAGGSGEVVIPGVPAYGWRDGCGPTSVGMVVGYYDNQGWDQLIPGDSTTNSAEAKQVIASRGTATAPRHYEDYSLPMDSSGSVIADRSAPPAGDEHASDSVADFMHTSWSADGLKYGWSWSNMATRAFVDYVTYKYPGAKPSTATYSGTSLTWDRVKQEIGAGRPMVFLVDSAGDGRTDHFVTIVGFREVSGYPEYACWDTWSTTLLRWQRFRSMSSSYTWGVWGGFTYSLGTTAPVPEPTPEPSPTATPTPEPTPTAPSGPGPADTTAPVTVQFGADDLWHRTGVTVTFAATDDASGVAYTEYSVDGGAWVKGTSVTVAPPKKPPVGVVSTVEYRSVDKAGNVEPANLAFVKLDTKPPVTTSNAKSTAVSGPFTLRLTASDPDSGVAATYLSVDGGAFAEATSATIGGAGRHTVRFYSKDVAGNIESVRSATVRIK